MGWKGKTLKRTAWKEKGKEPGEGWHGPRETLPGAEGVDTKPGSADAKRSFCTSFLRKGKRAFWPAPHKR